MAVYIRLMGDKDQCILVARSLDPNLNWHKYPMYEDKEETQIDKSKIKLYTNIDNKTLGKFNANAETK